MTVRGAVRGAVVGLSLGMAACGSDRAADPSGAVDFVVVTVTHASFSAPADAPTLTVAATIRNPSSAPVRFLPDCGGDFGIERWADGQWVPWGLSACRAGDLVTLAPGESHSATRSLVIDPGTFRLVVHEGFHQTDRIAYSGSFDAR